MEPTTPPPDPTAVTPKQIDATSTQFMAQPGDDPRWTTPQPPRSVGGSSAVPVFIVTSICLAGTCVLGALLGSWVLVVVGLVAALLVFHYVVWGWLYTRMIAAQQKEELLRMAEEDAKLLPDPQRSRNF
jgi:hypothetical protein